jgi:hypothetical protein
MTPAQQRIIDRISTALDQGGSTHSWEDVLQAVSEERAQWWAHRNSVVVTQVKQHPRLRELNVWVVAGDIADCIALRPSIEAWALDQGCVRAVGTGRHGWMRPAAAMGFQPVGVEYEMLLGRNEP